MELEENIRLLFQTNRKVQPLDASNQEISENLPIYFINPYTLMILQLQNKINNVQLCLIGLIINFKNMFTIYVSVHPKMTLQHFLGLTIFRHYL